MRLVAAGACIVAVNTAVIASAAATSAPTSLPVPPARVAAVSPAQPAGSDGAGAGVGVTVGVPAVVWPATVEVRGGRLRTSVLLADPTVTATTTVVGSVGGGCALELRQGQPRWLDCAIAPRGAVSVVVVLSDGRRLVTEVRRS